MTKSNANQRNNRKQRPLVTGFKLVDAISTLRITTPSTALSDGQKTLIRAVSGR